eukprot:5509247-Pyramimonas_sp.AAC.1
MNGEVVLVDCHDLRHRDLQVGLDQQQDALGEEVAHLDGGLLLYVLGLGNALEEPAELCEVLGRARSAWDGILH